MKTFKEMYELDLSSYTKKMGKTGLEYLEWATVITLLYQNGAEKVQFLPVDNPDGYPAFFDTNGNNPFVKVRVVVDKAMYEGTYPVIKGMRNVDSPNQLAIHVAHQRAFVKTVAINTGLGLKLWQKEEMQMMEDRAEMTEKQKPEFENDHVAALINAINQGTTSLSTQQKKYKFTPEQLKTIENETI